MVKYNDFGHGLRLGNYLFQYAFFSYASKVTNTEVQYKRDYFLWRYLANPPELTDDRTYNEELICPHTLYFGYNYNARNTLIQFIKDNDNRIVNVSPNAGFQSELWWIEDVEYIKNKLILKQEEVDRVKNKYQSFFTKPTVGIGIRRGDFVNHGSFYQIPDDWYLKALEYHFCNWKEDYNVVVFSDDIEWCKSRYVGMGFFFVDPNNTHLIDDTNYYKDPMEQFILGTLMNNFIGGSSTFTWWQMWYVKNFNNGVVVHTGKNLTDGPIREGWNNPDYYPKNWIHHEI